MAVTRDEVTALVGRRLAALQARDVRALASMHAVNGIVISPTGGVQEGREEIERVYRIWYTAFSDVITHQDAVLVDGDCAVQILRFSGTHKGEFFGLAATGRHVEVLIASVLTMRDGAITEERRIYDFTGLLVQVGVIKAKPQA